MIWAVGRDQLVRGVDAMGFITSSYSFLRFALFLSVSIGRPFPSLARAASAHESGPGVPPSRRSRASPGSDPIPRRYRPGPYWGRRCVPTDASPVSIGDQRDLDRGRAGRDRRAFDPIRT